jgi:hypothetical protein
VQWQANSWQQQQQMQLLLLLLIMSLQVCAAALPPLAPVLQHA